MIIFSDGEWDLPSKDWKSEELLAWLFNESPAKDEVVVNDRWGKDCRHKHGGYWTTEYAAGLKDGAHPWEESRGMAFSYGLNRAERVDDYKTARELILVLVDLVSRGGNLLLDIGPAADGTIPPLMEQQLLEIGDWLKVNGEAIYGTRFAGRSCQWTEARRPEQAYGEFMVKYNLLEQVGQAPRDGVARLPPTGRVASPVTPSASAPGLERGRPWGHKRRRLGDRSLKGRHDRCLKPGAGRAGDGPIDFLRPNGCPNRQQRARRRQPRTGDGRFEHGRQRIHSGGAASPWGMLMKSHRPGGTREGGLPDPQGSGRDQGRWDR